MNNGDYVVVKHNGDGVRKGMIGYITKIVPPLDCRSYLMRYDVVFQLSDSSSESPYMKIFRLPSYALDYIPDEVRTKLDVPAINAAMMESLNSSATILKSVSTFRLIEELKKRHEFNELEPTKIIFNDPATIVFWNDGEKTVVKCAKDQKFSEYYGYLAAMAKKIYGTNGVINRLIKDKRTYGKKDTLTAVPGQKKLDISKDNIMVGADADGDTEFFHFKWYCTEAAAQGFTVAFKKRKKAQAYLKKVQNEINTYGSYSLLDLKEERGDPVTLSFDKDFGWTDASEITIQKVSPTEWNVVFPVADWFRS